METHRYAARLVWTGAARGPTSSYATYSREYELQFPGKSPMRGSADPHFRGDASLYNPEEMLVASLSACHFLSYAALCARAGVAVVSYEDDANGLMAMKDGHIRFTEVVLRPKVRVAPGADLERARALHHEAHADCFIASSVNFDVRNEPTVSY
jgi:organic hydroperoxide reductase OsmC/OhrA